MATETPTEEMTPAPSATDTETPGTESSPTATATATETETPKPVPTTTPFALAATLTGAQETADVMTDAGGSATISVSDHDVTITVTTSNLTNVLLAHIHAGPAGTDGPVIFPLFDASTDPAFTSPFTRVLTAADFQPAPEKGISTFADALAVIASGNTYVNIHTQAHPGGEIRGQIS
ncbi:MAG: CHRD domain-containing protein [Deltaproteobacteria bacterium]|nr:CHRD domain-containing protein [Deltaproteobacteria bacterium]